MTTTTAATVRRFEVGHLYATNLACSSSTWLTYRVERRTAKSVWLAQRHPGTGAFEAPVRRAITVRDGRETCRPDGTYSMAPVLDAARDQRS